MGECLLCLEHTHLLLLGKCDHYCVCYKCALKMRLKMNNKKCPVCKEHLDEILVTSGKQRWAELDVNLLQIYSEGVFYLEESVKAELDTLNALRCRIIHCQHPPFNNVASLKRHYKEEHQKFTCEICSEHKAELFQETKLYSQSQFDRHLLRGDLDEDGNLIMYHPHCKFCNQYFYNTDLFSTHLAKDHFSCHVCKDIRLASPENKKKYENLQYTYFSSYQSLTIHFRRTHFFCEEKECIDKTFVVFQHIQQLESHMARQHGSYYDKQSQKFK